MRDSRSFPLKRTPGQLAYVNYLRKEVERVTGLSLSELKETYSEKSLFQLALKHVTTTKKAICEALGIDVENACRRKRDLEKQGLLVQSIDEVICGFTGHSAHLLTTNPAKFEELRKTNQLKLDLDD